MKFHNSFGASLVSGRDTNKILLRFSTKKNPENVICWTCLTHTHISRSIGIKKRMCNWNDHQWGIIPNSDSNAWSWCFISWCNNSWTIYISFQRISQGNGKNNPTINRIDDPRTAEDNSVNHRRKINDDRDSWRREGESEQYPYRKYALMQ